MTGNDPLEEYCPTPLSGYTHITLAHGGGKLLHRLVEDEIIPYFDNPLLRARHDGAVMNMPPGRMATTTDAHVVRPLFFPGGDIGALAVNGTLNDLAMCGARPLCLTLALILEEGLPLDTLRRVLHSIRSTAREAGVPIAAGDTKVIERGRGDGMYIATSGIGVIEHGLSVEPASLRPGDAILLSGDIGRHGMAVMSAREGLNFEPPIVSDCANLSSLALGLIQSGVEVRCMRDPTRGGLGGALWEIARVSGLDLHVREDAIPVSDPVRGACEVLGIDPLFVANEGCLVAFMPKAQAAKALEVARTFLSGNGAVLIGEALESRAGEVLLENRFGATRILRPPLSDPLPRIC